MNRKKLIRITTVPLSLDKLLEGQLKFMNDFYEVTAISSDKPKLDLIGEKENVSTFHLEMTRKITPFKDLFAVIKLFFFLMKSKPYIVHTHTPKAGIVGMLAAKFAGVPNRLHTVAGLPLLEAGGFKKKILEWVEKLMYSCATKVYPNSFKLGEIIVANKYCDVEKLKIIHNGSSNGISTSYFNNNHYTTADNLLFRKKIGILEQDIVFTFIGRIVSDKGINELVTAFSVLSKSNANYKLLLVGPLEEELDPLLDETKLELQTNKNIISVGYQNDVRPYLALSNIFVFPSYREGFPNVVMQAGAMGLPCIVTDINGCNEIIVNKKNGIIIPVKNGISLQTAMSDLATNRELCEQLAKNARLMIVERFEQEVLWQAILNEYQSL